MKKHQHSPQTLAVFVLAICFVFFLLIIPKESLDSDDNIIDRVSHLEEKIQHLYVPQQNNQRSEYRLPSRAASSQDQRNRDGDGNDDSNEKQTRDVTAAVSSHLSDTNTARWNVHDNGRDYNRTSVSCTPIPKRIHIVWLNNCWPDHNDIRADVLLGAARWREVLGSQWEVTVWDNARVRQEFPDLYYTVLRQLVRGKVPAPWSADIAKIAVIAKFGGISVDADIVPLRPIPDWLLQKEFGVCNAPRGPYNYFSWYNWRCGQLNNAPLGSFPGSNFFRSYLRRIVNNTLRLLEKQEWGELTKPHMYTGPMALSYFAIDFNNEKLDPYKPTNYLTVYPAVLFAPCGHAVRPRSKCFNEEYWKTSHPEALALHLWGHSFSAAALKKAGGCPSDTDTKRSPIPPTVNKNFNDDDAAAAVHAVASSKSSSRSDVIPRLVADVIQSEVSAAPLCTPIPKTLHIIKGDKEDVAQWLKGAADGGDGGWDVVVWTRKNRRDAFPYLYDYFDKRAEEVRATEKIKGGGDQPTAQLYFTPPQEWIDEVIRVSILVQWGGVLIDASNIPPQPIPEWMRTQEFAMCSQAGELGWNKATLRCRALSTSVLGAVPGSPAFSAYKNHLMVDEGRSFSSQDFSNFFVHRSFNSSQLVASRLTHFPLLLHSPKARL